VAGARRTGEVGSSLPIAPVRSGDSNHLKAEILRRASAAAAAKLQRVRGAVAGDTVSSLPRMGRI
jgi:hypothetical protein